MPTRELCALSLDYAWYHTAGSFVIVALCVFGRRWTALKASHWFGVFAMVMDFGVMFLLKGSRTIDWAAEGATGPFPFVPPPPYPVNITGVTPPMPPLTPVGTIAFFAWYDYLGAVGVMLFAFSVIHRKTKLDWFLLVFTPALFWSAPVASPWLGLDSRVLLVTRPSPKHLYVKLLAGMFVPLVLLRPKQVWSVYVAGVACGVTHHAALFFHGMRGYTSMTALFATVLTEWPVLVVGTFLCTDLLRRLPVSSWRSYFACFALVLAILAGMLASIGIEEAILHAMPYIPGEWMHNIGTFYFRRETCGKARGTCLSADDSDMRVMVAAAKGGAVLAAQILLQVGAHCGLCISGGSRIGPGIPGEEEAPPTFEGDMTLAVVNMRGWPAHVKSLNRSHRCVVLARDPEERLQSCYLYARSGGEYWLRSAGIMERLRAASNITSSFDDFWEIMGRGYLQQSHEYVLMSVQAGCVAIPYGGFKTDFNSTVRQILRSWHVHGDENVAAILERSQKLDFAQKSAEALRRNPHHSSSKFGAELLSGLRERIQHHPEAHRLIEVQRAEMML